MSVYLNRAEADAEVINNLLNEIRRLKGKLMSKIIVDTTGNVYRVESWEELSEQEVADLKAKLTEELATLQNVSTSDTAVDTATNTAEDVSSDSAPVDTVAAPAADANGVEATAPATDTTPETPVEANYSSPAGPVTLQ